MRVLIPILFIKLLTKSCFSIKCCTGTTVDNVPSSCLLNRTCPRPSKCGRLEISAADKSIVVRSCLHPSVCSYRLKIKNIASTVSRIPSVKDKTEFKWSDIDCCDTDYCNGFVSIKRDGFVMFICVALLIFIFGLFFVLGILYKRICGQNVCSLKN